MKSVKIALLISFTFALPQQAFADPTPTPSPSVQSQLQRERDLYQSLLRERMIKIQNINFAFDSAIRKAKSDARIASLRATTPEQKTQVVTNLYAAINVAVSERDSAIAALGPMPTPPAEPQRMGKSPSPMGINKPRR